jgi:hypothetical protein
MKNVPSQSGEPPTAAPQRPCRTCRQPKPATAFYDGCSECKSCKRDRSKRNRAMQARKIAAFERFVDVLFALADTHAAPSDVKEVA